MKTDGVTTVTLRIRQWMRAQIEATLAAGESAQLPLLATEAQSQLLSDAGFIGQIGEMIRLIAYQQGQSLFSASRHGHAVLYGDAVMERGQAEDAAAQGVAQSGPLSRWATWVEHAGKRYLPLMRMVDEDLRAAASERFRRSDTEREIGTLWLALADKLEGGQSVGERFSAEEIEALRKELAAKRNRQILNSARPRGR